jgi:hypothetical protein
MCESSEILQLQAEREFERDDFNRHINDLTAQNNFLYSENMKLKLALAESNASLENKKREYDSLILRIKEDSKKISELKTDR